MMKKFEIWEDHHEQWDLTNIKSPDLVVEADSIGRAVLIYSSQATRSLFDLDPDRDPLDGDVVFIIVRDVDNDSYYEVVLQSEIITSWGIDSFEYTTLEELCGEDGNLLAP